MSKNGEFAIWEVGDLVPHPDNPKKHSADQIKTLGKLIRRNGWSQPIVVQKSSRYIIAGHGRRLTALDLGLARVPVIVMDVDDEEAAAMRLADNRVVSTDYDTDLLQRQMAGLAGAGFDLSELGFSDKELEFMVDSDLSAFDESAFIDDITSAVDGQKKENDLKRAEVDAGATPVGEAFGFKKMTIAQSRRVKSFVAQIEGETKLKGAAALMKFFDSFGIA